MRYRTKSADVLTEADRYQRILDWQLFHMAQETQLWGHNEGTEWKPGIPIYKHPDAVIRGCPCEHCRESDEELWGYYGHYVRPMFQTIEFADRTIGENVAHYSYWQLVQSYANVRCEPCGVSWRDGDTCWMCGVEYHDGRGNTIPKKIFSHQTIEANTISAGSIVSRSQEVIGQVESYDFETNSFNVTFSLRDYITAELERELGERWREAMDEMLRGMSIGARRVGASLNEMSEGFRAITFEHEDYWTPVGFTRYNTAGEIEPYHPPIVINPFEREEREIELVRPVAPTIAEANEWFEQSAFGTTVRGGVEIPDDVDLDRGPDISRFGPQMPEPRDFSDWEYRPRLSPPTTPFRRNR